MKFFFRYLLFFAFSFLLVKISLAQKPVPELWGQRIHDEAHALKTTTIDQLENELKRYEDTTSNQIAVLIVQSLDGEVLENYSLKVAEKWKLGQKNKDNGVLLLIAIDDHKIRIEVGQGLEGVLTDAQSNRLIRNEMAPEFRRGDYDAGVKAGVAGIIKAIAGEYAADDLNPPSGELGLGGRIMVGLFLFVVLGIFTTLAVFVQGCAGWGLYAFLIPFYAVFPWVAIGKIPSIVLFVIYVIGLPILKVFMARSKWGKALLLKFQSSSSGWGSSSSSSSSWGSSSSWSSGGSSFSGGGGSFGGGGSSGSW